MTDRDIHNWEELLAGREAADAHPHTAREARLLRRAILEDRPLDRPILDAQAKDRLLARLKHEGVIDPVASETIPMQTPGSQWLRDVMSNLRRPAPVFAPALAVAALFVIVLNPIVAMKQLVGTQPTVIGITRAASVHLVVNVTSQRQQAQALKEFQSALDAVNIAPHHYEVEGNFILQFQISRPVPAPFGHVLKQYNLRLPTYEEEAGVLRPWVRQLLQSVGQMERPQHQVRVEFTHHSGG